MKTNKLYLILLSIVLITSVASCKSDKSKDASQADEVKITQVYTEVVKMESVPQNVEYTANIEANVKNNIAPGMPGRIRKIYAKIGDRVQQNQVLVEMDKTNMLQQQTQLENLKRDYERYKELFAVGGVSQQQLDQLNLQIELATNTLSNLNENTTLRSPMSGIVTARNYDPGDMSSQFPILTVESMNPLKIIVNISESYYSDVKVGMPADITFEALGDRKYSGKIALIHPTLNPGTHTFPVEIQLANNDFKVRPGMFATVNLNLGSKNHALVSDQAVLKQKGTNDKYVFVVKDNKAIYTKVELGNRFNDKYEIISGLKEGDVVVNKGNTNLSNLDQVEIKK